jgi:hypothetical protein
MTELSDDALHLYKVLRAMVKDNKDRYCAEVLEATTFLFDKYGKDADIRAKKQLEEELSAHATPPEG